MALLVFDLDEFFHERISMCFAAVFRIASYTERTI